MYRTLAIAMAAMLKITAVQAAADLIDAAELLRRLQRPGAADSAPKVSVEAQLLADVKLFRTRAAGMEYGRAAQEWFSLLDRSMQLGQAPWQGNYDVFDGEIGTVVSPLSVLASLPSPDSWPAMRDMASARARLAENDSRTLAVRMFAEVLARDLDAARKSLEALERAAQRAEPRERERLRAEIARVRYDLARLFGSREDIATAFVGSLAGPAPSGYSPEVAVPDLVGLVGPSRAEQILRLALSRPVRLHVKEGLETRAIARRVALEMVASLPVPQWGLADALEAAPLYEALQKRFVGAGGASTAPEHQADYRKSEADAYYLLSLIVAGRQEDAQRVLRAMAGQRPLHVPKEAIEALQRAGHHEALYAFLHSLLQRHPEIQAWDVYTREAAATGHGDDALTLTDELLSRGNLADYVADDLRYRRVNALLALDRLEPALAELRQLLASPPTPGDRALQARSDAALRLAGLGRVLGRPGDAELGLRFGSAVLALPAPQARRVQRDKLLRGTLAELRKQGRNAKAQDLAIAELQRETGGEDAYEQFGMAAPGSGKRAAVVELAALYGQADRPRDVLLLLEQAPQWGARDLAEILGERDSLGVPLGLVAARALAASGDPSAARAIARALVAKFPGYDPAYELLLDVEPDALAHLDRLYESDQFEERPLIWKAILLSRSGRHAQAEAIVKRAIAIDPSDGEQGPRDRMRAYAVLADTLEGRGEKNIAAEYRNAVAAIRISEESDELHALGLYQRAFTGYRRALDHFADAYCIQSRLAVRLNEQGRRKEAAEHFRRAYELMPASFGRVESHCFGCESVFQGPEQQGIAETVFKRLRQENPRLPQVHYLLGYLEKERGRAASALPHFRRSVQLDEGYLNAWKHLNELAEHVYIDARERDVYRLKLLQLDPRQRHVSYDLTAVGNLELLWHALGAAASADLQTLPGAKLYRLDRSAAAQDEALAKLPEAVRAQMRQYQALSSMLQHEQHSVPSHAKSLGRHVLVRGTARLMGISGFGEFETYQ